MFYLCFTDVPLHDRDILGIFWWNKIYMHYLCFLNVAWILKLTGQSVFKIFLALGCFVLTSDSLCSHEETACLVAGGENQCRGWQDVTGGETQQHLRWPQRACCRGARETQLAPGPVSCRKMAEDQASNLSLSLWRPSSSTAWNQGREFVNAFLKAASKKSPVFPLNISNHHSHFFN